MSDDFKDRADAAVSTLTEKNPDLFREFSLDEIVGLLDSDKYRHGYGVLPDVVETIWKAIRERYGSEFVVLHKAALMAKLISDYETKPKTVSIPHSVRDLFLRNFRRILNDIECSCAPSHFEGDAFLKDLAICQGKLIPAGAATADTSRFITRSTLIRAGVPQFYRFAKLLLYGTKGTGPFYEVHTHTRMLEEFNETGWDNYYLRVSELLKLDPEVRGTFGTSWFYDPEISRVSPRLAYLRERPLERGASLFYCGVDAEHTRMAIEQSKTRRALYHNGQYLPVVYMIVWPRKALIEWASSQPKVADAKPRV